MTLVENTHLSKEVMVVWKESTRKKRTARADNIIRRHLDIVLISRTVQGGTANFGMLRGGVSMMIRANVPVGFQGR